MSDADAPQRCSEGIRDISTSWGLDLYKKFQFPSKKSPAQNSTDSRNTPGEQYMSQIPIQAVASQTLHPIRTTKRDL